MSDLLSEAESLPDKPARSRLETYADVIFVLRKKRYSYKEIADYLLEKRKLKIDPSTIWDFVKVRAKHKRSERVTDHLPQEKSTEMPVRMIPVVESNQKRVVYVPQSKTSTGFDPASLKTNDEVDEG